LFDSLYPRHSRETERYVLAITSTISNFIVLYHNELLAAPLHFLKQ
jgi:hypothetical protein